jgi:NitT/TauT family transport system substrate-binding protein
MRAVILAALAALGFLLSAQTPSEAQDRLRLAIGQRGIWDASVPELGQNAGIFKKHGLVLDIFFTQGAGETLQAVISGSADIGGGVGTLGVMGAFARGAPIRIIAGNMTGANDTYLYVPAESPLKSIKDADGKAVAFSTVGSSTHMVMMELQKLHNVKFNLVATGGPTPTMTSVMSGQVDVGWAAAPFGVQQQQDGKIRVLARASDVVPLRTQTSRVYAANLASLESKRNVYERFMLAYREALDWMYSDPAALKAYAELAGTTEQIAKRLRDEFLPKKDVDPANVSGLHELMAQAVSFKFMPAALTQEQLDTLIALPEAAKAPPQ